MACSDGCQTNSLQCTIGKQVREGYRVEVELFELILHITKFDKSTLSDDTLSKRISRRKDHPFAHGVTLFV